MGNSTINDYDWFIFQHAMCDENSVDWTAHLRPPLLQGFGIWWRVSGVSAELSTNGSVWNSPPNHFHIKNDYFDLFWSILICIYIYIHRANFQTHMFTMLTISHSSPQSRAIWTWISGTWNASSLLMSWLNAMKLGTLKTWPRKIHAKNDAIIWQCVKTNSTPVVHIKIAGKWMFIPLKMV